MASAPSRSQVMAKRSAFPGPGRKPPDLAGPEAGPGHAEERHPRLGQGRRCQVEDGEGATLREDGPGLEGDGEVEEWT